MINENNLNFQINPNDIVKLILLFLKENNLLYSMKVLEDESKVKLNTVEDINTFKSDIKMGRWDLVLRVINKMEIQDDNLVDFYEEIIYDLIENDDLEVAKLLYNNINKNIFREDKFRISRLENILLNGNIKELILYRNSPSGNKNEKRNNLANNLAKEVYQETPGRLNHLIKEGIESLFRKGIIPEDFRNYDLLTGNINLKNERGNIIPSIIIVDEQMEEININPIDSDYVRSIFKQLNFGQNSYVQIAKFSNDGEYLATGSKDGILEIWDPITADLKSELAYQKEEPLLFHNSSVTSLNFTKDSKMICSGDIEGNIKLFKVSNGKCLREFPNAHSKGITSLVFSPDNSQIISGSFDSTIRIFGLKIGKMIHEFSSHTSFINDLEIDWTNDRLFSASADGTVKIWNIKQYELINTITPISSTATHEIPVNNILLLKNNPELFFICNKSNTIYLMNINGSLINSYTTEKSKSLISSSISFDMEWLYAVDEENTLFTFSVKDNIIRNFFKIHEKDVIGLTHHPKENILVSYALDGILNFYK